MKTVVPVFYEGGNLDNLIQEAPEWKEIKKIFQRYKLRVQCMTEAEIKELPLDIPVFIKGSRKKEFERNYHMLPGRRLIHAHTFSPAIFGDYENLSAVSLNFKTELKKLFAYLKQLQVKSVALFGVGYNRITCEYYVRLFSDFAHTHGIELVDVAYDTEGLAKSYEQLSGHMDKIDAVICYSTVTAVYIKRKMEKAGIRIPQDKYLISRGDKELAVLENITSMQWNENLWPVQCVNLYLQLVKNPDISCLVYTLKDEFLIMGTTDGIPLVQKDMPVMEKHVADERRDEGYRSISRIVSFMRSCDKLDYKIITGLLKGKSTVEISFATYLSENAVTYRISRFLRTLELGSRKELLMFLMDNKNFVEEYIKKHEII